MFSFVMSAWPCVKPGEGQGVLLLRETPWFREALQDPLGCCQMKWRERPCTQRLETLVKDCDFVVFFSSFLTGRAQIAIIFLGKSLSIVRPRFLLYPRVGNDWGLSVCAIKMEFDVERWNPSPIKEKAFKKEVTDSDIPSPQKKEDFNN